MLAQPELDELVLFDLPAENADQLWARLAPSHLAWILGTEEGYFVVAALRAESEDLARLLRAVETWITESDLPFVRFILDGRDYVLRAHSPATAARAA
jgi:hypothetical protein